MDRESIPEVTPKQAAKSLGVSTRTVFNYIKKGRLKARKKGQKVFIAIASIEEIRKNLSIERHEKAPGFPEKPPDFQETTLQGAFSFQFNPSQHLIVDRRDYEALLVRLGHLESEVKLLKHETEDERKVESPSKRRRTFGDWFWGRE